eukprot:g2993.t1
MTSTKKLVLNSFGICFTLFFCVFTSSVRGGIKTPLCNYDCSNIDAVDAVCGNHICSDGPVSKEAREALCSNFCQAAFADLSNDECEGDRNRVDFYAAVDNLDAKIIELCTGTMNKKAPASVVSEDEDELGFIEKDLQD